MKECIQYHCKTASYNLPVKMISKQSWKYAFSGKRDCDNRKYPVKHLFMLVYEYRWRGKSSSCIAGKFLQHRKRGGKILVLMLNVMFLE